MTTEELIREGLALVGDEVRFRHWSAMHGLLESGETKAHDQDLYLKYTLADLAFMAREKADGDQYWELAIIAIHRAVFCIEHDAYTAVDAIFWWTFKATSCHWILAGIVALEMAKNKSK
jgi:hypothetical protein